VTYKDTVEYCRFLDRAGSERIILALEGPKGYRRVRSGTVFYGFDVFGLIPGFPDRINMWEEGASKVKQDRFNGLRGISGKEG